MLPGAYCHGRLALVTSGKKKLVSGPALKKSATRADWPTFLGVGGVKDAVSHTSTWRSRSSMGGKKGLWKRDRGQWHSKKKQTYQEEDAERKGSNAVKG